VRRWSVTESTSKSAPAMNAASAIRGIEVQKSTIGLPFHCHGAGGTWAPPVSLPWESCELRPGCGPAAVVGAWPA